MKSAQQLRQQLNTRHQELSERLQRITQDRMRKTQPLPADFADQAVHRENDEVLDRLDESTRAEIRQVEHALARIDQGQYGVCEACGQTIDEARQLALPHATHCYSCASARQPTAPAAH